MPIDPRDIPGQTPPPTATPVPVTLTRISPHHLSRVAHIQVAPAQVIYSGTVQEAFEEAEPRVDFHGIQRMGQIVGFFKIDRDYFKKYSFATPMEVGLRAFMVDQRLQGQGVGTAAVAALPAYIRATYPGISAIALTVNQSNPAAYRCYAKGGFEDTGQIWTFGAAGPQNVMRMPL